MSDNSVKLHFINIKNDYEGLITNLNGLKIYSFQMVPRGGFEPPTRGFSVRCSTN